MKIKFLLVTLFCILLSSCGLGGENEGDPAALTHFESSNFSIDIPASWKQLSIKEAGIGRVPSGDIHLIASADNERFGVANSLLIMSEPKTANMSVQEYTEDIFFKNLKQMASAQKLEGGVISFNDKTEGTLGIYDMQYSQKTNRSKYIIATRECNNNFYILNIAIDPSVTTYQRYIDFLKTFQCS